MSEIIYVLVHIDFNDKIEITLFNKCNNANVHNINLYNNEGKIYKRVIRISN